MDASKTLLLLAFAVALPVVGGEVAPSAAPGPVFRDCESTTNASIRAAVMQNADVVNARISLLATPSNMVQVAFGKSASGDGVLLPGDESLSFGWRNGAWFFASPSNRVESAMATNAAHRNPSFQLRLSEEGRPRRLTFAGTDAGDAFAALVADPPGWMFSREWDAVRLGWAWRRGLGRPSRSSFRHPGESGSERLWSDLCRGGFPCSHSHDVLAVRSRSRHPCEDPRRHEKSNPSRHDFSVSRSLRMPGGKRKPASCQTR